MTTEHCLAPAIRAYEKMLSQIQESQGKMLATKSLLLNFQDQSSEKTAPGSRHEELTESQRDFDTLGEYLEQVLEFCCSYAETLSQSMLLVATSHSKETSIQQRSTEMKQIYSNIRSTHDRIHALQYKFPFEIEKTVYNMLGAPSVSSLNKATMELHRYQELLKVLTSATDSVPKLHVERAGSAFLRIFRWLLRRPWDTQQHTSNQIYGKLNQPENGVRKDSTSVFFRSPENCGGYDNPIPLSDDEDEGKPIGSPMRQIDSRSGIYDGNAGENVQSQAQVNIAHLLLSTTSGTREKKLRQPRNPSLSSNASAKLNGRVDERGPYNISMEKRKVTPGKRRLRQRESSGNHNVDKCSCVAVNGAKCATENECSFRAALTECRSACGRECKNRRISCNEFIDSGSLVVKSAGKKGSGLFTDRDISKDQLVIEYIGEQPSKPADGEDKPYLFQCGDTLINGNKGGNNSKFLNHSCQPNLVSEVWQVKRKKRIVFFATQEIKKDTELTFSYNRKGTEECFCGATMCSGTLEGRRTAAKGNSDATFE